MLQARSIYGLRGNGVRQKFGHIDVLINSQRLPGWVAALQTQSTQKTGPIARREIMVGLFVICKAFLEDMVLRRKGIHHQYFQHLWRLSRTTRLFTADPELPPATLRLCQGRHDQLYSSYRNQLREEGNPGKLHFPGWIPGRPTKGFCRRLLRASPIGRMLGNRRYQGAVVFWRRMLLST